MPIISRTVEVEQVDRVGSVFADFSAIDAIARVWHRSAARFSDKASAIIASDTFDWTTQLIDADFDDILMAVQGGIDPSAFNFRGRDLVLSVGEERLMLWFAIESGANAITIAAWVSGLSTVAFDAISLRIGYTARQVSDLKSKAVALNTALPWFNFNVKLN